MQTEYRVTIPGEFPSLNQFIAANRTKPILGNKMKQESQIYIKVFLREQMRGVSITEPIYITYHFYCKNKKRDLDNISSYFTKVFQDSMVELKTIPNDGWNNIIGFEHHFHIDKDDPRIEVQISPAKLK